MSAIDKSKSVIVMNETSTEIPKQKLNTFRSLFCFLVYFFALTPAIAQQPFDAARGIILRGTVVTMDAAGTILHKGNVLVRNGKIVATWEGPQAPDGNLIGDAVEIDLGPKALIFPGLINLHNHPTYSMLNLWAAPSSHVQTSLGRPLGTEPYANRYQWNIVFSTSPPEYRRLVDSPQLLLVSPEGLNLYPAVEKYAEIKAMLGGETAFQGAPADPATDNILIRNVDNLNFNRDRIESRVSAITGLSGSALDSLLTRMRNSQVDAWITHLAEGVRDNQRRDGDPTSSRAEFATLVSKGLLTDATVIIHGNGLEPEDFAAMRDAPSIRLNGTGDGRGAKLVWSPLSNLLLYGQTALIYPALNSGLTVSLGTDWSPSGSRNLLDELKIADIILRGSQQLAGSRDLIPSLSITKKTGHELNQAETALDKLLVEMVTTNPAKTLRWDEEVGSIEAGKFADLLVLTKSNRPSASGLPDSPYRNLIDATEEDIHLVLVNGEPLAGDVALMATVKPSDYEVITSTGGCFQKAIDVTNPAVPKGTQTFAFIQQSLVNSLNALGGDNPPPEGGPADDSNTYSYLKANIPGAGALTDSQFRQQLAFYVGLDPQGRLNLEAIQLSPLLVEDDDFYFHLLGGEIFAESGLIADITPPYRLYPANFNQLQSSGNPFATPDYRDRYFDFCALTDK
jgi:5-methylthioadenosine/S-adenosylhomocysteine deaminase